MTSIDGVCDASNEFITPEIIATVRCFSLFNKKKYFVVASPVYVLVLVSHTQAREYIKVKPCDLYDF